MTTARKHEEFTVVVTFNAPEVKRCAACGKSLSLSHFHRKGVHIDSRCKVCVSKIKRKNYLQKKKLNKDRISNIIIKNFDWKLAANMRDLIMELELFLLEEFKHGQRSGC